MLWTFYLPQTNASEWIIDMIPSKKSLVIVEAVA